MKKLLVLLILTAGLASAFIGCAPVESDPVFITQSFSYTATGDMGMRGQAAHAQIRMARTSDSLLNDWADCQIISETIPWKSRITDTVQAGFLIEMDMTYYFGIKIGGTAPIWSTLSNVIMWTVANDTSAIIYVQPKGGSESFLTSFSYLFGPSGIGPCPVGDFSFAD